MVGYAAGAFIAPDPPVSTCLASAARMAPASECAARSTAVARPCEWSPPLRHAQARGSARDPPGLKCAWPRTLPLLGHSETWISVPGGRAPTRECPPVHLAVAVPS